MGHIYTETHEVTPQNTVEVTQSFLPLGPQKKEKRKLKVVVAVASNSHSRITQTAGILVLWLIILGMDGGSE